MWCVRVGAAALVCAMSGAAAGGAGMVQQEAATEAGELRDAAAELMARGSVTIHRGGQAESLDVVGVDAAGRVRVAPGPIDQREPIEAQTMALTDRFVVELAAGADADEAAARYGADVVREVDLGGSRFVELRASDELGALELSARAAGDRGVSSAEPVLMTPISFESSPIDPMYPLQWHLRNTPENAGEPGHDINVEGAWGLGYTGAGQVISVVDTGIEYTHPDLASSYRGDLSWDFDSDDSNPQNYPSEWHGTSVAGLAVAAWDGERIVGVAPGGEFAAVRIGSASSDTDLSMAMGQSMATAGITNASWGYAPATNYFAISEFFGEIIEFGIREGRGGLGRIYVTSAGNSATIGGDANRTRFKNSRYTIVVGASSASGGPTGYSSPSACVLVNAPSSCAEIGVATSDISGFWGYSFDDFTEEFGGTSAASPIVAGVVALMLEANPDLTWRDVQHILASTASRNDPSHDDWAQNGAGLWVNHSYGFGRVDAEAAVLAALDWTPVADEVSHRGPRVPVGVVVPSGSAEWTETAQTIAGSGVGSIEAVEITIEATHPYRGDLQFTLVSPDGTESVLSRQGGDNGSVLHHTFTTLRSWGESADGEWTLRVRDTYPKDEGVLDAWTLEFFGTSGEPEPTACVGDCTGDGLVDISDFFVVTENFGRDATPTLVAHGDVDRNGRVDLEDLFRIAANFGCRED